MGKGGKLRTNLDNYVPLCAPLLNPTGFSGERPDASAFHSLKYAQRIGIRILEE